MGNLRPHLVENGPPAGGARLFDVLCRDQRGTGCVVCWCKAQGRYVQFYDRLVVFCVSIPAGGGTRVRGRYSSGATPCCDTSHATVPSCAIQESQPFPLSYTSENIIVDNP